MTGIGAPCGLAVTEPISVMAGQPSNPRKWTFILTNCQRRGDLRVVARITALRMRLSRLRQQLDGKGVGAAVERHAQLFAFGR